MSGWLSKGGRARLNFSVSIYGQMVGTCEEDVEPANAVKIVGRDFLTTSRGV